MSMTKMPKYLTGDKQAIENFIDQFDVCTPRWRKAWTTDEKGWMLIDYRTFCLIVMVWIRYMC